MSGTPLSDKNNDTIFTKPRNNELNLSANNYDLQKGTYKNLYLTTGELSEFFYK